MYFLSIKRYNLEYISLEKLGNGLSHYTIAIFFVLGKFCRNRALCIIENLSTKNILISKSI